MASTSAIITLLGNLTMFRTSSKARRWLKLSSWTTNSATCTEEEGKVAASSQMGNQNKMSSEREGALSGVKRKPLTRQAMNLKADFSDMRVLAEAGERDSG